MVSLISTTVLLHTQPSSSLGPLPFFPTSSKPPVHGSANLRNGVAQTAGYYQPGLVGYPGLVRNSRGQLKAYPRGMFFNFVYFIWQHNKNPVTYGPVCNIQCIYVFLQETISSATVHLRAGAKNS